VAALKLARAGTAASTLLRTAAQDSSTSRGGACGTWRLAANVSPRGRCSRWTSALLFSSGVELSNRPTRAALYETDTKASSAERCQAWQRGVDPVGRKWGNPARGNGAARADTDRLSRGPSWRHKASSAPLRTTLPMREKTWFGGMSSVRLRHLRQPALLHQLLLKRPGLSVVGRSPTAGSAERCGCVGWSKRPLA
jgi:hypothetical protein